MKFPITLNILLLFVAALFFTACEKDNIDDIVIDEPEYTPDVVEGNNLILAMRSSSSQGLDLGCLTVTYPFDLALESGSTVTINSESDFTAAIDTTAADPVVDFVYPLDILDSNGNSAQVNSIDELGQAFVACIPNSGWTYGSTADLIPAFSFTDLCFDLVYPVALEDLDGNTYTADDEDDLIDLIATVDQLFFTLPITVTNANGDELVIDTYDGFSNLVESCEGVGVNPPVTVGGGAIEVIGFGCYELQYPFTIQLSDGSTVVINDEDEYITTILNADDEFQLAYPFTLESLINGDEVTIANGDEFIAALNNCGGIIIDVDTVSLCETPGHVLLFFNQGGAAQSPCRFTINFPLDIVAGGTTYTLNEFNDYWPVYNDFNLDEIEIVYPVDVTVNLTGENIEFTSDDDLCNYIETCE
jgi:hypothetical protein